MHDSQGHYTIEIPFRETTGNGLQFFETRNQKPSNSKVKNNHEKIHRDSRPELQSHRHVRSTVCSKHISPLDKFDDRPLPSLRKWTMVGWPSLGIKKMLINSLSKCCEEGMARSE